MLHKETTKTPVQLTPLRNTGSLNIPVSSYKAIGIGTDALMITCAIRNEITMEARALLDSISTASFVSECMTPALCLHRNHHSATITGIDGPSLKSPIQSMTSFRVSLIRYRSEQIGVTAAVVPCVTGDLPCLQPHGHTYLILILLIPLFGQPGRIDNLLGVDIFTQVLRDGQWTVTLGSSVAFETQFNWVLAGEVDMSINCSECDLIISCHRKWSILSLHYLLRRRM